MLRASRNLKQGGSAALLVPNSGRNDPLAFFRLILGIIFALAAATAAMWMCFLFLLILGTAIMSHYHYGWLSDLLASLMQHRPVELLRYLLPLYGVYGLVYHLRGKREAYWTSIMVSIVPWMVYMMMSPSSNRASGHTMDSWVGPLYLPLCVTFGLSFAQMMSTIELWEGVGYHLIVAAGRVGTPLASAVVNGLRDVALRMTMAESRRRLKNARVDPNSMVRMTSQLGAMFKAGVPLLRAIEVVADQEVNLPLKMAMKSVAEDLMAGSSIARAMSRHPKIFSPFVIGMIKMGETTGHMDVMVVSLAEFLEREWSLIRRAKSAITYPIFVLIICLIVVWAIFTWILPSLITTFTSLARSPSDLPLPTQIIQYLVQVCTNPWAQFAAFLFVMTVYYCSREFYATPGGRLFVDKWKLHIPVVGNLQQQVLLATFFRSLGTLLEQAIPIVEAMNILIDTSQNVYFRQTVLINAVELIKEGVPLSKIVEVDPLFPKIARGMLSVADETGEMGEMMLRLADVFDQQVIRALDTFLVMIEPVLIFCMGILVAFVLLSVMLPLYHVVMELS